MASIKVLHVFIVLILSKDVYGFPKFDFKRRVNMRELKTTHRPDSEIILNMVLNKHNRTHEAITTNCTVHEEFGKLFHLSVEMAVWGDGGWKRNLITYEKDDSCKELKFILGTTWDEIIRTSGASNECPIAKGFYHITNYYVDATTVPLIFDSGLFKLFVVITKNQKFVLDVELVLEIIALYT